MARWIEPATRFANRVVRELLAAFVWMMFAFGLWILLIGPLLKR